MSVRLIGLPAVTRRLDAIASAHEAAGAEAATHLKKIAETYPPVRRQPQPFKSDKARRGFFAALKAGRIEVPYRRGSSPSSKKLGMKWRVVKDGSRYRVVNDTDYGPLVMGRRSQSLYHRGNWKTDEQIAREESRPVGHIYARHYAKATRG